ncbi:MAG: LacI family transcriptional regulator, partial [Lentisphaerae bacterium]
MAKAKLTRLIDVARKAGVSRVAVAKVLLGTGGDHVRVSEKTAHRIREVATQLGYRPNRSAQRLRGKTGNLIGAFISIHGPLSELSRLIAFERLAAQSNYNVIVYTLPHPHPPEVIREAILELLGQGCCGVVFIAAGIHARRLGDVGLPAAFCGIEEVLGQAPGVIFDIAHGIEQVIGHFKQCGRRRIALVLEEGLVQSKFPEPYAEYWKRHTRLAVEKTGGLSLEIIPIATSPLQYKPGIEAAQQTCDLLIEKKIEAVLTKNDYVAARLLQVFMQRGVRVPEDIAICGSDNLEMT